MHLKFTVILSFIGIYFFTSCNTNKDIDKAAALDLGPEITSPFDTIEYNKVVAYNIEPGDIIHNGKVDDSIIIDQKELSAVQIDSVNALLLNSATYGGRISDCFIPHFSLIYFLQDSVVADVSICLICNRLKSSINLPYYDGFSDEGREKIITLIEALNFRQEVQ